MVALTSISVFASLGGTKVQNLSGQVTPHFRPTPCYVCQRGGIPSQAVFHFNSS